ncbi:hypothetical protein THRCLA_00141 [Thraustotheca clavata]|uniref:DEP domain-containing protein n=1 Tax=Thraustotheca clavata TaxID=74557 RepID=A0A1W0AC60_9STRA|nr:hypothetical protein THRCLA_00141 [Thraustotheca clavata]
MVSYVVAFGQKYSTVSGNELTQCLINHNYAFTTDEAIRMGNALMDAGILHHEKHMKAFENSSEELYVFHEGAMEMNQPLIDNKTPFGTDDGYSMDASSLNDQSRCRCKKLAQGHAMPVTKPKKWFRRPHKDLLLDNNALTVHLLNDAGAQEAVHVSRLDFPQTVF